MYSATSHLLVFHQRGCDGIGKGSIDRESELRTVVSQTVHVKWWWDYITPLIIESYRKRPANESDEVDRHSLRPSGLFDNKTNCIFYSCQDPYDGRSLSSD